MEKKQNGPIFVLLKYRSWRNSFKESMELLFTNIKTFLISLALPCLVIGIVTALFFVEFRSSDGGWAYAELAISVVIILFCLSAIRETIRLLMLEYSETKNLTTFNWKRKWKSLMVDALPPFYEMVVQAILIFLLLAVIIRWNLWYVQLIVGLVLILLVVPLNIVLNLQHFGQLSLIDAFKRTAKLSLRYFGSTWMLLFVSIILIALTVCLFFLPVFILNMAISASNAAVLYGDPSDLPSSILWIHFFLSLLLISIVSFSACFWLLPQYFHHFSMMKNEAEREKEERKRNATIETYRARIQS